MSSPTIPLKAGLKFKSKTFANEAEIVTIDEASDTVRIRMTRSDDTQYETEWPLLATREHFKQGFYFIPKAIPFDVTTT